MKLNVMCMECQKELGHPSFEFIAADYYEDATCYITCSRQHKSAVILQNAKFEILLESAARALTSGYTLEAASSLSSAYERAIEFAVHVFSKKMGISREVYKATYKQMAKQSERQIGAFLAMHCAIFGTEFQLSTKIPPKRNEVIHQGKILSPDEVMHFGELIYSEISVISEKLRALGEDVMRETLMEIVGDRHAAAPSEMPRATSTGANFFCYGSADNPLSFAEALARFQDGEQRMAKAQPTLKLMAQAVKLFRPALKK